MHRFDWHRSERPHQAGCHEPSAIRFQYSSFSESVIAAWGSAGSSYEQVADAVGALSVNLGPDQFDHLASAGTDLLDVIRRLQG